MSSDAKSITVVKLEKSVDNADMKLSCQKTQKGEAALAFAQEHLDLKESGEVAFRSHDKFRVLAAAVGETLNLPHHWTKFETVARVSAAIIDTVRHRKLDWASFMGYLNTQAEALLKSEYRNYAMWTKVGASPSAEFGTLRFNIDGVSVTFSRKPPRRLVLKEFDEGGMGLIDPDYPRDGMFVTARGKFRSEAQAGEGLFKSIADVCGLINVAMHIGRRTFFSGVARPKATLLTGKYHFLFDEGEPTHGSGGLWYNPDFREDFWKVSVVAGSKILDTAEFVRLTLRRMPKCASRERIRAAFQMLHEGWQAHDLNQRILRTWTAFETLLSRSRIKTDDYETIIRRALFFAKNPAMEKIGFDLAVRYRNRFVHENSASGAAESVAEYLDNYLLTILQWLLRRRVKFETHERLLDMLDTPIEQSRTLAQIEDRRRGLRVRTI